jgi:pimeloyl-ACP methyl ester carboxylesterase
MLQAATMMPLGADVALARTQVPRKQTTFVLVHGAFHGGWCYARVAEILRRRGCQVFTPTLTGLGERSHVANFGIVNCSTHIQDVVNVIKWEQLSDVVLCGHSYGGMVVGGVADAIPERISSLVYLDAIIPNDGQSILDLNSPQGLVEIMKSVANHGGNFLPPFSAEFFNVNPSDRAMVDSLCTPQPFATLAERIKLTGAYMRIPKKTYIHAANWKGSYAAPYERVKDDNDWTAIQLQYGHDVMLDAPEHLAKILMNAVPA